MSDANPTEIRIASVFKDENDIIIITMKDCGMIDEYDVMDLNLVLRHKADNQPALKLYITTGDWEMTKKGKEMAEKEDNISRTRARALVVSNSLKASAMNFLQSFSGKSYPQQFFSTREEAYAWLLSMRQQALDDLNL
jgi:hypothetical protein